MAKPKKEGIFESVIKHSACCIFGQILDHVSHKSFIIPKSFYFDNLLNSL